MSPEKMTGLSFAAPLAKLCEALGLHRKTALHFAERFFCSYGNYLPSMASARLLSQSPCTSSMRPASHAAAMAGSMGSLAVLGMPCLAAMASMWLSPKMACCLPQSGQVSVSYTHLTLPTKA